MPREPESTESVEAILGGLPSHQPPLALRQRVLARAELDGPAPSPLGLRAVPAGGRRVLYGVVGLAACALLAVGVGVALQDGAPGQYSEASATERAGHSLQKHGVLVVEDPALSLHGLGSRGMDTFDGVGRDRDALIADWGH